MSRQECQSCLCKLISTTEYPSGLYQSWRELCSTWSILKAYTHTSQILCKFECILRFS